MFLMVDVTVDQPPLPRRVAVQDLASEKGAFLTEALGVSHHYFAPLFFRREQRAWAERSLRGLPTADVSRNNVEVMALHRLGVGPHAERQGRALQPCIGESTWDNDTILAEHPCLVNENLGEGDGVLIVDGSDFPTHGDHSAGVAPPWCGHTGKQDTCQAGVCVGDASRRGATILDRHLSLPACWFDEEHRTLWQDCRIPRAIAFQTTHELAAEFVEQTIPSSRIRACWVACDEGSGDAPACLQRLDAPGCWYVAEVPPDPSVWPLLATDGHTERACPSSWVRPQVSSRKGPASPHREGLHPDSPATLAGEDLAMPWPVSRWQCFWLLEGHKGSLKRLPGPDIRVVIWHNVSGSTEEPAWNVYLRNAPLLTPLCICVRVGGMRWPIETCCAECKREPGLHHFLVCWHQRLNQREGVLRLTPPVHFPYRLRSPVWTSTFVSRSALLRCVCELLCPQPVLNVPAALALIASQQCRNAAVSCSVAGATLVKKSRCNMRVWSLFYLVNVLGGDVYGRQGRGMYPLS